jgi:hypothetical protein
MIMEMKRAWFLVGLLSIACLCSPGSCFLFHIFDPSAPERDFEIEELLVDVSSFPAHWYVVSPPAPYPHYDGAMTTQAEDIYTGFKADSSTLLVAGQLVYRFGASWKAAAAYREQLPVEFNNNSVASLTPWEIPRELPYESEVADQFHLACHVNGIGTPATVCEAMAQYEEYLVVFHTVVDSEYMTYAELERILVAIDERMALYLDKDIY